jgi:hypothetical protein
MLPGEQKRITNELDHGLSNEPQGSTAPGFVE